MDGYEALQKFQTGLSVMENAIPIPQGGAEKRPGTKYIAEVKTSSLATRLLPFEFSTSQSYIIETGNQYMRFYTSGARINGGMGTEDLSSIGSIVAHWLLNDNAATTAVLDDDGNTHDGVMVASTNTEDVHQQGIVGGAFNFDEQYAVEIVDSGDFTFDDSGSNPFSIAAWIYVAETAANQYILAKWDDTTAREWSFVTHTTGVLRFNLYDQTSSAGVNVLADSALTPGWHFVAATYDSVGGATAGTGVTLYVDGASVASTVGYPGATYVQMRNTTAKIAIGAFYISGTLSEYFRRRIDNVAVFSKELSSSEITTLWNLSTYEIVTPYLTADLFGLKYEQSADVLYLTHPDYETRKLLRRANARWELVILGIEDGPFRSQNADVVKTISASATTGSVTLTAVGHAPFVSGTTAGHPPSGTDDTDKSQTGALFKIVHPIDTLSFKDTLEDDIGASQTEGVSWMSCGTLYNGTGWTWITGGTWLGTIKVQRNYTIGAAVGNGPDEGASLGWETVFSFDGVTTARNVSTTGTESDGDADYRVIFADDTSGTVISYFTTDQTEHIGIAEITAVSNKTSATATVLTTLASTDATHKWSEGAWSNYRGWAGTVTFFEDRIMFGGNTAQPDTIWGSVTGDYENMTAGADDDEAVVFTLSSRQVNVIEWLVGKDKLLIGTSGAEWSIVGGTDEPLSPSNVIAKQHSTYGSADLQANLANESVLFFQRGAEKMRELAYNWELDSYVAPDMTILANIVTNTGITDTAFQRTPNSILWTTRTDGELPIFSYERAENITAWSRMITQTNLAGTLTDSDIESVAVINGSPEDEVWVIVERTIGGSTVRYIEQFQPRDFGDSTDAIFVDASVTYDSTASSAMTGLDHLDGQTVYVLADGVQFDTEVVSSGAITLSLDDVTTTASTVQMGLGYEVQLRTMPLSWVGGESIQGKEKKISETITRWYKSGDFSIGKSASKLNTHSITNQTTSIDRKTFPPGWDRNGYVFVYQLSPEPLTLLSIMVEFSLQ